RPLQLAPGPRVRRRGLRHPHRPAVLHQLRLPHAGAREGSGGRGGVTPHTATFADLDTETLYALLKLRVDVFVVEQECPYPELDGRDAEPGTRHVWLDEDGEVVAYLRILLDADGVDRIGRVCTAKTARGGGRAGALMRAALDAIGDR